MPLRYREFQPVPALARLISCYWLLEGEGGAPEPIFPDGCMEVAFHFGQPFRRNGVPQGWAVLVGQMTGPVVVEPSGRVGCFGIRFRPGGAWPFLRFSQAEVTGGILPLDDVWPDLARQVESLVSGGWPWTHVVAALDRFLQRRLRPDLAARAATLMAGGRAMTERHHRRLFREIVGVGPKTLARIQRFQHALGLLRQLPAAEAACQAGFADQAHMIHDFREFAGITPRRLLQQSAALSDAFARLDG